MPLRFTDRILSLLARAGYHPAGADAAVRELRIDGADREAFDAALARLLAEDMVTRDDGGVLRLPAMGDEIVGRLRLNPRGFGFVVPERPFREGDLYVPEGAARDAISGDLVRARVSRAGRRRGRDGRKLGLAGSVLEVLERGQEHFVGVLVKRGRTWIVEPDGRALRDPVIIRDPHAKGARAGHKVVIELLHYPEDDDHAEGVIIRVLGEAGRPDVETQAVIAAHGLRTEFAPEAVRAAQAAAASFGDLEADARGEREDLTGDLVFTIDPPDARDFDDAISIALGEGDGAGWTLGVHIADVARFVPDGGPLDEEARARGNSVYLPRLVIPMLPEVLSNGVCSLQEGVPRLTQSVFITFDRRGRVLSQRAAATVIRSAKRLTYLEAQALIDGDRKEAARHARSEPVYADELVAALERADELARTLRKRRLADGMIVLDLPEVDLVFDEEGHVIDVVPEDDAFTHTLIEMLMVEANEAIARLFDGLEVPVLRRIHPDPSFSSMEDLRMYARAAHLHLPDDPTRADLQRLLEAARSSPSARAIHFAVLRTLTKATYSPAALGHFALASDHYAHFTSPIRRYPDLLVHRALAAYLDATDNGRRVPGGRRRTALRRQMLDDARVPGEDELLSFGRHLSETEQEAEGAERELRSFLVLQFLKEHHLGDEFPGVVSGVVRGGVFVSVEQFLVEGLVRTADLPGGRPERWRTDEATGRLVAGPNGPSLGLGDPVRVQIVSVDLASRQLELRMTGMPKPARRPSPAAKKDRPQKARRPRGKGGRRGRR